MVSVDPEIVTLELVAILKDSMIVPDEFFNAKVPVPLVIVSENVRIRLESIATPVDPSTGDVEERVGEIVSAVIVNRSSLSLMAEVIKL